MKRLAMLLLTVVVLTNCRGRENSITGSYGNGVLSGVAVVADGSSPAGIEVTASGMVMTLGEDGRFVFAGVRDNTVVHFRRLSDGIDAQIETASTSGLTVELSGTTASRRRGAAPSKELQYEGLVRAASATEITVYTSHNEEVKIAIEATTVIRKGQTTVAATDLKAGDRVHVKAIVKDTITTATEIIVQNPADDDDGDDDEGGQTMTANGLVLSVDGTSLKVQSQPKGEVTVQTDANTIIKRQGETIAVSDIRPGDEVNSMGKRVDDTTLLARQIEVRGVSKNKGKK